MERRTFLQAGLAGLGTTLVAASSAPAQFIPNQSKEKWAVLYGTWYGTARDASVWISEGMGGIASVFDVRQVPADLNTYNHLIIGTAIHGGRGPQALESYINSNVSWIQSKVRGLFAVCGNMGTTPGQQQIGTLIDNYLARICKAGSVPRRALGGRLTKTLMPESEYQGVAGMYASLVDSAGNWDNLSRAECLKLGREILSAKA
jgi:menaquinone-dependent protoporphyrinogen IX oxidase